METLFKPISFLKKGIASAVIVCLIWTQFCVGVAKAVLPSDADLGMSDVIIYQTDSMGFTVSATDTGTGIQTQYFAGGMIDYTYYTVYNENGERIEIKVTDYDYHTDGRIKTITDCQTGDYIIYGNTGVDLDGDGEITGDEIKGWGAVEERAKADAEHPDGRIIGVYEYDTEGVLLVKHIYGNEKDSSMRTSYIDYTNGNPSQEIALYFLLDTDGNPSTEAEWVEASEIPGLDGPVAVRVWNYDPASGELTSVTNTLVTTDTATNAEATALIDLLIEYLNIQDLSATNPEMVLLGLLLGYSDLLAEWVEENGAENWQDAEFVDERFVEELEEIIGKLGGINAFLDIVEASNVGAGGVTYSITVETTRFDDEGRTTGIYRDDDGDGVEEQVGGFDYSTGNMTSWYIDPEGLRTESTYDSMGRIQRSVTFGDITSEVDLGSDVDDQYQYMTVNIHSVTTFVYNDTAESVTLTYSDEPEYDVSFSGDFDLPSGFSVSGGESGGMPSVDTSGMDVDADVEFELTPNDDRIVITVTIPPGGLMTSRTVSTTTGNETFGIDTAGIIPIEGEATVYVDNITETTVIYDGGMAVHSVGEEIHNGSYVDVDIDEESAWTVAIVLLVICILLAYATNGLSLYAWATAAFGAYQTYNDIMDLEGTNPVPNLPTNIFDPNNAYDEVSIKPPIEPPTESEFGTNDAYIR